MAKGLLGITGEILLYMSLCAVMLSECGVLNNVHFKMLRFIMAVMVFCMSVLQAVLWCVQCAFVWLGRS